MIDAKDIERVCAWCGLYDRDGQWVEGEPTLGMEQSHVMCPACDAKEGAKIDAMIEADKK